MITTCRWYERPVGAGMTLPRPPELASWDRSDSPGQQRLRSSLAEILAIGTPMLDGFTGPVALRLDVGLPTGVDLLASRDLDNYLLPLATACQTQTGRPVISAWGSKQHAPESAVLVGPPIWTSEPAWPVRASANVKASSATVAFKEAVAAAVADVAPLPPGPVRLQLSFTVGPTRNWLNLWKPAIDSLDALLGREIPDRRWRPADGRITELGLHCAVDPTAGWEVSIGIAAGPASPLS